MKKPSIPEPKYPKKPTRFTEFGIEREDPYFWLREKENPEVRKIVDEENAYFATALAPIKPLIDECFEELKGLIEPDLIQIPYLSKMHLYGSKIPEGKEYSIHFRKKSEESPEEVLLDVNAWAEGQDYTDLGACSVSDDENWLAFSLDRDGSEHYRIQFKDLRSGKILDSTVPNTHGDAIWSSDGKYVYYTKLDEKDRPNRVFKHALHSSFEHDELVYEEKDPRFFVGIDRSKDGRWILIDSSAAECSETWIMNSSGSDLPRLLIPRRERVRSSVLAHGSKLLALSNHEERNFGLYEILKPGDGLEKWKRLWVGDAQTDLRGIDDYDLGYVVEFAVLGKMEYRTFDWNHRKISDFKIPGESYRADFGDNAEVSLSFCRLNWSAPNHPGAVYEFDLRSGVGQMIYERKAPLLDPNVFEVKREIALSNGVQVPYTILSKKGANAPAPTVLVGYGSYGMPYPDGYRAWAAQLVKRGFRVSIAHIRGGGCLGQRWYEDGKFERKMNTFLDFNACAEDLITKGYTRQKDISIMGGSAGGMLVCAAMNLKPDLYRSVMALVPFVDVLNTMLDDTLPLTPTEFDEWGNPKERKYFDAIREYSPYDNVREIDYPHVYLTAGWSDPRVTYWEPLKFCARLRERRKNKGALTLMRTVVEGGHGGLSGRYESLHELAEQNAFLLSVHNT